MVTKFSSLPASECDLEWLIRRCEKSKHLSSSKGDILTCESTRLAMPLFDRYCKGNVPSPKLDSVVGHITTLAPDDATNSISFSVSGRTS